MIEGAERWAEAERTMAPLWAPVALGAGICAWFALPGPALWLGWTALWLALALFCAMAAGRLRSAAFLALAALLLGAGCLLPWGKALLVGAPPLARPAMAAFEGEVRGIERLAARGLVRLRVAPADRPDLPALLRVTAPPRLVPAALAIGDRIALRAYLMPPPSATIPGAYDYAMRAYFDGVGATGRALGAVRIVRAGPGGTGVRERLGAHIAARLEGSAGAAIAVAFANGDQAGIAEADADAMRRSGLAHLLSISGLHVSALIGAVIFLVYRLLALSPALALRWPLLLVASICGAAAGIGYTLLTSAQVPTVRSCIAALLVIGGLALGREAISLRLVASGALVVMLFWPEAVVGPSFQMSFAAVVAIVALYEYAPARRLLERREEGWPRRLLRALAGLFATGLLVELVLAPIAIYHFHRSGLLGAVANMVAIPLTSFVVMPAEALALILDLAGLGAPAWAVTGWALDLLLWIAHAVSALPFAVMRTPLVSDAAFAAAMLGVLWMMLWKTGWRWLGAAPAALGMAALLLAPVPDILVTGDGRHVAVRLADGRMALLRDRAGDYVRDVLSQGAGYEGELAALSQVPGARCSLDACLVDLAPDGVERQRSGGGDRSGGAERSPLDEGGGGRGSDSGALAAEARSSQQHAEVADGPSNRGSGPAGQVPGGARPVREASSSRSQAALGDAEPRPAPDGGQAPAGARPAMGHAVSERRAGLAGDPAQHRAQPFSASPQATGQGAPAGEAPAPGRSPPGPRRSGAERAEVMRAAGAPPPPGAPVRLLALRSTVMLPWASLVAACASADIVVADRRLPQGCAPRWLKLDKGALARTGGAAIDLGRRTVVTARDPRDRHPWVVQPPPRAGRGRDTQPRVRAGRNRETRPSALRD